MSEPDWAPLTGFRVAVTSARRAEELGFLPRQQLLVGPWQSRPFVSRIDSFHSQRLPA